MQHFQRFLLLVLGGESLLLRVHTLSWGNNIIIIKIYKVSKIQYPSFAFGKKVPDFSQPVLFITTSHALNNYCFNYCHHPMAIINSFYLYSSKSNKTQLTDLEALNFLISWLRCCLLNVPSCTLKSVTEDKYFCIAFINQQFNS